MLNGLDEQAWAGLAGIVGVALGAIAAAVKGAKKSPIEVGITPPPPDLANYSLEEIRAMRKAFDAFVKESEKRWDEAERVWALLHQDTQVLRDRRGI